MVPTQAMNGERGVDVAGPDDGRPIVFVHGVMFTRKMWAPQRDALADECKVIALDLPGHGERSDRDFAWEPALSAIDDAIETHADGDALLVGLSLGGYLSTEYARRNPDAVDGLVISGSSANPVGGMEYLARGGSGVWRLVTRSERVDDAVRTMAKRWTRKRGLPRDIENEIIESGFYPPQFGIAGTYLAGKDFRTAFADYPGPSLVLNGGRDAVMRGGQQEHVDAGQDARLEVIEGVGHVCNLHRPREYASRVRAFDRQTVAAQR